MTLEITSKTLPSKGISRKVGPQNGNFKIWDLLAKKFKIFPEIFEFEIKMNRLHVSLPFSTKMGTYLL